MNFNAGSKHNAFIKWQVKEENFDKEMSGFYKLKKKFKYVATTVAGEKTHIRLFIFNFLSMQSCAVMFPLSLPAACSMRLRATSG